MKKLLLRFGLLSSLCFGLAGCGDGTLEIKSKSTPPATPVVIIEKPNQTTTKETKVETRTPDGNTTKTTEVKTTNP